MTATHLTDSKENLILNFAMHAYLIISNHPEHIQEKINYLAKELKVQIIEFPFAKIEDAKTLTSFTKLAIIKPTAVVLTSIEEATTEALNAILKNLEEAPANLYYFLTAGNLSQVLPTIVSRCQVIKIANKRQPAVDSKTNEFFTEPIGKKFGSIDKIRERGEARNFVENLVYNLHDGLVYRGLNPGAAAQNLDITQLALDRIKANGNIQLQLTNMVINLN